ncbi:hypothetical protein GCM10008957_27690 [Deinococcus ruber]|uniref:GmrSD restriction endonucleases N-terminal domain-containing protein n=1 Tax=Deinococcus ruber TaxID=1848197 RepID=A0A918C9X7_9DEIO|nr:hypothetical protein GCM10008957_27690 [Deinococcus ruber]
MVMPARVIYGNAGNRPLEQLLLDAANYQQDLLRPAQERLFLPGEYVFGYRLPTWQRPAVWRAAQQIRLIESCFLGFDIGRFLVTESHTLALDGLLLDGQQRLLAIRSYLQGEITVFGARFQELTERDRRRFLDTLLPTARLNADQLSEAVLIDLYVRLNYGGTAHTAAQHPFMVAKLIGDNET